MADKLEEQFGDFASFFEPPYTILIDVDDVIFETSELLLSICNRDNGTHYTLQDITSFGWFEKTFPGSLGLLNDASFWNTVKVVPDAVDVIKELAEQGHTIKFVTDTNCTQSRVYAKFQRLLSLFNTPKKTLFTPSDIIICADKHLLSGQIIIDDKGSTLVQCFTNQYPQFQICFNRPWNQTEEIDNYITERVKSWKGFVDLWNYFVMEYDYDGEGPNDLRLHTFDSPFDY